MTVLLTNNATTTLASSIIAGDTSIVVATGDGALFPSPTGGDWFPVTLTSGTDLEVVHCTARSTDTLTVTRAQEGTTALAFPAGADAELRLTASTFDALPLEGSATGAIDMAGFGLAATQYDLASLATTATLDLATGNTFTVDASVARTLTFANVPASTRSMTVTVTLAGNSAITWPAGIRWHGGTAPTLGATWTVVVLSWDGTNWNGVLGASA